MSENYQDYVKGILLESRRSLAKAITLIESNCLSHITLRQKIIDQLLPNSGKAVRIGITGIPGVGKSTFIESFGLMLANKNHKVAVLSIDPSSSISGGSIMADKTRMEQLSRHSNAFIRPSPSGGTLGGVSKRTRESIIICEAAGFDIIIVETVGVGQSEINVSTMVDFFLVLMLPGAGDGLQGIKKGVLEIADALVINKADGDNILKAEQAKKTYETALHMLKPIISNWSPPVLTCSAILPSGMEDIWNVIMLHNKILSKHGDLIKKRRKQAIDWMWSSIEYGIREHLFKQWSVKSKVKEITEAVQNGEMAPTLGSEKILALLCKFLEL